MDKKKQNFKKVVLPIILLILFCLLALVFIAWFTCTYNEDLRKKAISNPPSAAYVEEDAEKYLISTNLYVYNIEQEGDCCVYYIEDIDTSKCYRVLYEVKLKRGAIGNIYNWEFVSFIETNKDIENEEVTTEYPPILNRSIVAANIKESCVYIMNDSGEELISIKITLRNDLFSLITPGDKVLFITSSNIAIWIEKSDGTLIISEYNYIVNGGEK